METVSRYTATHGSREGNSVLLPKTSTPFRRRLARVAVAGVLVTVPLATLAVTASAQTPDTSNTIQLQSVSDGFWPQGNDNDGHPRGDGRDGRDDNGPRHDQGDHRGPDVPDFHRLLPPTGSG
jgi:hypothetical protein